jgi:uncharacterized membrane protein YgdD (TMEM256/DUF423 family)
MGRLWVGLGALAGLSAVAMAAFAAHGLGWLDPKALHMVESGIQMQGWHALALLGTGIWAPRGGRWADAAGFAFSAGIGLFCGAVYTLALTGASVGGVAPAGGTLLMIGWALLAASAVRAR